MSQKEKWYRLSEREFQFFAQWFRKWFVVLPFIVILFVGIELFLLYGIPEASLFIQRIVFYSTVFSSLLLIYASVSCRSYTRSKGDSFYRMKTMNNLGTAAFVYILVLLFLTVVMLS